MPPTTRYALYYPTLEFRDPSWLWSAALVWDRIYRICPDSVEIDDAPNIRELMEDGEIGQTINPAPHLRPVADRFLEKVTSNAWDASALDPSQVGDAHRLIHRDKVDQALRELIVHRTGTAGSEWLPVSRYDAALYMTLLAKEVAEANGLRLLTDSLEAWTGERYFEFDGQVRTHDHDTSVEGIASLIIADFTPRNVTDIAAADILKFRRDYADERRQFVAALESVATRMTEVRDPEVAEDILRDAKAEVARALKAYRGALTVLKVTNWDGMKALSFPLVAEVAKHLIEMTPQLTGTITWLGLSVGAAVGVSDLRQKRRELGKESPYSYLHHCKNKLGEERLFHGEIHAAMHEFIED